MGEQMLRDQLRDAIAAIDGRDRHIAVVEAARDKLKELFDQENADHESTVNIAAGAIARIATLEAELKAVRTMCGGWETSAMAEKARAEAAEKTAGELREALEDLAEGDCEYGDQCPDFSGSRHGSCVPCIARAALARTKPGAT